MGNPESLDWVRLEVLILRRACTILRKMFRRRWKQTQNKEWQDTPIYGKQLISGLGLPVYQSCGRLHKMTLEEGDVDNWDFTILTRILQQVAFKLDDNGELKSQFESENLRIEELISCRKQAMDYPKKSMEDDEFSKIWDQIEKILVSLGENEKELEQLKRAKSVSEDDLRNLSGVESHPVDQGSIVEARRLKDEAKVILSSGKGADNAINCLTSAIGLQNLSDLELGALFASRSEAYLKKAERMQNAEERKQTVYMALKDAKHALYLRPAWGLAHYRVGSTYVELGKHKKAAKYLDQALDLEPNMDEIKVANNTCKIKLVQLGDDFAPEHKTFQKIRPYSGGTRLSPEVKSQVEFILFQDPDDNTLGDIYKAHRLRDGIETRQNYKEAAALYRKSAKSRNAEGMYNLALLKLEGKGVKQDVKAAIELLKKAAKLSHKLCNGNGLNFVSNVGKEGSISARIMEHPKLPWVPPSLAIMLKYVLARDGAGVAEAGFLLGYLASEGIGFPPQRDLFSASVWYNEASEHGHGPAAHNLALLLSKGQGVMRDSKRALQLWKLGASRKVPEAMIALAIHHAKEWDTSDARRWLHLAINEWRTNNYEEYDGMDDFMLTPSEIQRLVQVLDTIDAWRGRYGLRDISRWESHSGLSPGRIMNQNLHMQSRLMRMLRGMESEKDKLIEIEEYFRDLRPKPVIISLPAAKAYITELRKQIRSHGSVGSGDGVVEITEITDDLHKDHHNDSGRVSKASTATTDSDNTFISTSSSEESDSCAFVELEP